MVVLLAVACGEPGKPPPPPAVAAPTLAELVAKARQLIDKQEGGVVIESSDRPPPPPPPGATEAIAILERGLCPDNRQAPPDYAGCTPRSRDADLVDEAWMLLGDQLFLAHLLPRSIAAFRRVADRAGSPKQVFALYRVAWSHYKQDQLAPAIDAFDAVARATRAPGPDRPDLYTEAILYLAIAFTDPWADGEPASRGLDRAMTHYRKRPEPHAPAVFDAIGDAYVEMEESRLAAAAYLHAIRQWPDDPNRGELERKLAGLRHR